jgi:hypothetical protein
MFKLQTSNFKLQTSNLRHVCVWLRRIAHCRGFGIQSPSDYWFVRYVINEHWPYYSYESIGKNDDWLTRKLGRLYFRLSNWRQPGTVCSEKFREYLQAGCHSATIVSPPSPVTPKVQSSKIKVQSSKVELMLIPVDGHHRQQLDDIYNKVDDRSVVIIDGIHRDWDFWHEVTTDKRTGVTFDLYYCGLVMFDKKRVKKNYIINF